MTGLEIVVGLVIAVGLVGMVVPVLPGTLLVAAAIVLWATERGGAVAWGVLGVSLGLLLAGAVVKYLLPGRHLRRAGVPSGTLLAGAVTGFVGFFVVPVVGLPLGFVLGIYLVELSRLGHARAWPATVHALQAVGLGIAIELAFGTLAALTWAVGVVIT